MTLPRNDARPPLLVTFKPVERPRARIVCCSYAGGSASAFSDWPALLPDDVELCAPELPGRGGRFRETPLRSMVGLVDYVLAALDGRLDASLILYGHSMGGVVALELAQRLSGAGMPPAALVVSGCPSPQLPSRRPRRLFDMPREDLVRELGLLEGLPQRALEDPAFIDTFMPMIRADMQCREEWQSPVRELALPVHVLGGVDDKRVMPYELEAWQAFSSLPLRLRMFAGGHFFIHSNRDQVVGYLAQVVAEVVPGR